MSVDFDALLKESGIAGLNELTSPAALSDAVHALARVARELSAVDRECLIDEAARVLKANRSRGNKRLIELAFKGDAASAEDAAQGHALAFADAEPWPDDVDGAELLDELVTTLERFVSMSPHASVAAALWIVHTHALDAAYHSPRLAIVSPTKRCGKTTLLSLLRVASAKPMLLANITAAALYRTIESHRPTLLVDEADSFMDEKNELRGVINAGHERSGVVVRCDAVTNDPRTFSVWAPMAIAAIGKLPSTVMDRSIVIEMRRLPRGDSKQKLRHRVARGLDDLPRKCARWVNDHSDTLRHARPDLPDALNDRASDHWEPLFAIADAAEGDWPTRAREAATRLQAHADADADASDQGTQLLADIRDVMTREQLERVSMQTLCARLAAMDDRPWGDQKGKPLTTSALGRMLRAFEIKARSLRDGPDVAKGYDRQQFQEAFTRYLLAAPVTSVTSAESLENEPNEAELQTANTTRASYTKPRRIAGNARV